MKPEPTEADQERGSEEADSLIERCRLDPAWKEELTAYFASLLAEMRAEAQDETGYHCELGLHGETHTLEHGLVCLPCYNKAKAEGAREEREAVVRWLTRFSSMRAAEIKRGDHRGGGR